AVLALLGPGDELVAPGHDIADVGKADQLELADDLLDRQAARISRFHHPAPAAALRGDRAGCECLKQDGTAVTCPATWARAFPRRPKCLPRRRAPSGFRP